jgi:hypothetical protein
VFHTHPNSSTPELSPADLRIARNQLPDLRLSNALIFLVGTNRGLYLFDPSSMDFGGMRQVRPNTDWISVRPSGGYANGDTCAR